MARLYSRESDKTYFSECRDNDSFADILVAAIINSGKRPDKNGVFVFDTDKEVGWWADWSLTQQDLYDAWLASDPQVTDARMFFNDFMLADNAYLPKDGSGFDLTESMRSACDHFHIKRHTEHAESLDGLQVVCDGISEAEEERTLAPSIERNRLTIDGERRSDLGAIYLTVYDTANVLDLIRIAVRAMNDSHDIEGVGGANYGLEEALKQCSATLQDVADAINDLDA